MRPLTRFARLLLPVCLLCAACSDDNPSKTHADPAIGAIDAFIADAQIDRSEPDWRTHLPEPPQATFSAHRSYFVRMETNKGVMRLRFLPEVAPKHVTNHIYLTRLGFYDGLIFHRVIRGFMAQGGDPVGNGNGDPGYQFEGEFCSTVNHDRPGLLSMANAGPGTDGSQFFLTFVPTPWLDGKHTIFGELVEGQATLDSLEAAGSQGGAPRERLTLDRCTIEVQ